MAKTLKKASKSNKKIDFSELTSTMKKAKVEGSKKREKPPLSTKKKTAKRVQASRPGFKRGVVGAYNIKCDNWPECDYSFRQNSNKNVHMTAVHQVDQMLSCPKCLPDSKHYANENLLYQHDRQVYPTEEKALFRCDAESCGKLFMVTRDYERHWRTHSGLKPYSCPICQRGFTQRSTMKQHILRFHMTTNDHLKECSICGRRFTPQYFPIHEERHKNHRDFFCHTCNVDCALIEGEEDEETKFLDHLSSSSHQKMIGQGNHPTSITDRDELIASLNEVVVTESDKDDPHFVKWKCENRPDPKKNKKGCFTCTHALDAKRIAYKGMGWNMFQKIDCQTRSVVDLWVCTNPNCLHHGKVRYVGEAAWLWDRIRYYANDCGTHGRIGVHFLECRDHMRLIPLLATPEEERLMTEAAFIFAWRCKDYMDNGQIFLPGDPGVDFQKVYDSIILPTIAKEGED